MEQPAVWISKEIIPRLIIIVEDIVKKIDEGFFDTDGLDAEDWDINDAVILDHFVLPILRDNLNKGFYSDELLYKGWMFLRVLMQKNNIDYIT